MAKTTFDEYVRRAREKHGDKYSYIESSFTVMNAKLTVVCPLHGEFKPWAMHHLKGSGCPRCRFDKASFLKRAQAVHGDRFSYPEPVEPVAGQLKIECAVHGIFKQRPNAHLAGSGCNICGRAKRAYSYDELSKKLAHSTLKVSSEDFNNRSGRTVRAYCSNHGESFKRIDQLLTGIGCQECYFESKRSSIEEMEAAAREAWGNTYTYDWDAHLEDRKRIFPICKKHGKFSTRKDHHFSGFGGCPKCRRCSYGELAVASWLDERGVSYKREWTHETLRSPRGFRLKVDFALPDLKLLIEYDGPQHFEPWIFGKSTPAKELQAVEALAKLQEHDRLKNEWAKANGFTLIRLVRATLFEGLENEVAPLLEETSV